MTLPDGAKRPLPTGATGADLAASIAKSLAKKAIALKLNGKVVDLSTPINADSAVEIVTPDSEDAIELYRHDCAHVLAEAVQELYPGTQVTIGPAIENGFYYDFARDEPFTPDDLATIEAKMKQIIQRNEVFEREEWDRDEAIAFFEKKGEAYKAELIRDLPESETISVYRQGEWLDLCRGPHMPSTGKIGTAFKLMSIAGAYWRGDHRNAMLQRIYGTCLAHGQRTQSPPAPCWRRLRSATTAGLAVKWACSICRKKPQAQFSGTPKAGRCIASAKLMCGSAWKLRNISR